MRLSDAGDGLGSLCGGEGNLCQLVGCGVRGNSDVTHHHDTVGTVLRLGDEQHGTAHAGDAGSAFDNLQGGAQRVASGAEGTGDLTVGVARLDNHAAQIEVVVQHELAGLVDGHALLLTELSQLLGILFGLVEVQRVDDTGLVDVGQSPLLSLFKDVVTVADKDDVGNVVGQHAVSGFQCALFLSLRQHDALLVSLGTGHDLL